MESNGLTYKIIDNSNEENETIIFLNNSFTHGMNKEIWDWEFKTFENKTILAIIKDGKEIIATHFVLPVNLSILGKIYLSGKAENGYCNSKYRGQGLYQKLNAYSEKISLSNSIGLVWGFTSALNVFEKTINFNVFKDTMYTYTLKIGKSKISNIKQNKTSIRFIKYLFHFSKYLKFKVNYIFYSLKFNYSKVILDFNVNNELSSDDDLTLLYDKIESVNDDFIHINIDKSYFDWRITNNPNLTYIKKFFYKDNQLHGNYVFSVLNQSVYVTDFTSCDEQSKNMMMIHMFEEISKFDVIDLNYLGNIDNIVNRNNFNLFKKFGGTLTKSEGMYFIYKTLNEEIAPFAFLNQSKNWYINGLWTEGFKY